MAYTDFSLAKVRNAFGLTLEETRNLFLTVEGVQPSDLLKRLLDENLTLATAINSEKALNLSQNPFQTSFPARGWKCLLIAALPLVLRRSLRLGIPSQRLGTRESLKTCSRLAFTLS